MKYINVTELLILVNPPEYIYIRMIDEKRTNSHLI